MKTLNHHQVKTWMGAAAAVLLAGLVCLAQEKTEPEAARLTCAETVYDFGQAETGSSVEHTFLLRNEGGQPLEITRVKAGCGCTATKLDQTTIAPGGEVELNVTLSLAGRRGGQKKWVLVESDAEQTPSLTLWMKGVAHQPLQVTPTQLYFGLLGSTPEQTKTVKVLAGTGERLAITNILSSSAALTADVETVREGIEYKVAIHTHPPFDAAADETVTLQTDDPDYAELKITVHLAADMGELLVAPEVLEVPAHGEGPLTRQVLVGAPGVESFSVRRVEMPDPAMRFMIWRLKPNSYRVAVKNIFPSPDLQGREVRIITDLEGHGEIVVPFRVDGGE